MPQFGARFMPESIVYDENAATKDLKQLLVKAKKLKSEFAIKSSLTNRGLMLSIAKDAVVTYRRYKLLSEESPPISLPSPRNVWNSWKSMENQLDLGNSFLEYDKYIERLRPSQNPPIWLSRILATLSGSCGLRPIQYPLATNTIACLQQWLVR